MRLRVERKHTFKRILGMHTQLREALCPLLFVFLGTCSHLQLPRKALQGLGALVADDVDDYLLSFVEVLGKRCTSCYGSCLNSGYLAHIPRCVESATTKRLVSTLEMAGGA